MGERGRYGVEGNIPAKYYAGVVRRVLTAISCFLILQSCIVRLPQYDVVGGSDEAERHDSFSDWGRGMSPPEYEEVDQYPEWFQWVADGSVPESGSWDLPPHDLSGDDGKEELSRWSWECPDIPMERVYDTIHEFSFIELGEQEGSEDRVFVYPAACGFEESKNARDATYLIGIREAASLGVEVRCSSECYLYLTKGGCLYAHIQGCWHSGTNQVHFLEDVLPGLYLVAVEFVKGSDPPDESASNNSFDIHVSVNRTLGQDPCIAETITAWSDLETAGGVLEVAGTLDWSREDNFFVKCPSGGYGPGGKLGGMPDTAHALVGDFEGKEPRKFSIELSFPNEDPKWIKGAVLAVSTTPCGEQSAIIDCTWGSEGQIRLENLWIFPGEQLYALVDLSGIFAFDLDGPLSYVLTWFLEP